MQFNQISPNWAGVLLEGKPAVFTKDGKQEKLDIFNASTCVVGEAHGFTEDYYYSVVHEKKQACHECTGISMEFVTYVQSIGHPMIKSLDRDTLIKRFEEHWSNKHG